MENNMKYIKLYENFQEKKPISAKYWNVFSEINKKFRKRLWVKKNLFDNGDGTFDYDGSLEFDKLEINSLKEVIPLPIKNVSGDFGCQYCTGLKTLEYAPQSVGKSFICSGCTGLTDLKNAPQSVGKSFWGGGCTGLTSLKYAPQSVGEDFSCSGCTGLTSLKHAPQYVGGFFNCIYCTGLTSLKYAPQSVGGSFNCSGCTGLTSLKHAPQSVGKSFWGGGCTGLISDVNEYGHEILDWKGYSRKGIRKHLNAEQFSAPVWYESLAFVGARNPKAYVQVCKDFPEETKFTQEQVDEIYKSDLIDYESTLADAVVLGLPAPQEIMDRTKKYDHSEYRDSKLDSEWKEIF